MADLIIDLLLINLQKYEAYKDGFKRAKAEGKSARKFCMTHGLDQNGYNALDAWWRKNHKDELVKVETTKPTRKSRISKYEAYKEGFNQSRLNGESGWTFCKENNLSKNVYNCLDSWWIRKYPEKAAELSNRKPQTPKYVEYREALSEKRG